MRRLKMMVASLGVAVCLMVVSVAQVSAYGGGAGHDTWQIGISANCNNPAVCGQFLGGFWGWAEFDRSADGTQTWGDAEFAGCSHMVGGGGPGTAGAGHVSVEIESWTIAAGSAGPMTFWATGEQTLFLRGGVKLTVPFVNFDTGFSATPGHYSTVDVLGFKAPGVAYQIQISFRAAK
jgi:hypothetical protein